MIVIAVLSGVFFWAARYTLREKDPFPDYRGTKSPTTGLSFGSSPAQNGLSGVPSARMQGMRRVGTMTTTYTSRTYSQPSARTYTASLMTLSVPVQGGGLRLSSGSTVRSYGSGMGVSSASSTSTTRSNTRSTAGGGHGLVSTVGGLGNTSITQSTLIAQAASTETMVRPTRQLALLSESNYSSVVKRKVYGTGDDEEENNPNLPSEPGSFDGERRQGKDGNWYIWYLNRWYKEASQAGEDGAPIGNGLALLLLMAAGWAVKKKKH